MLGAVSKALGVTAIAAAVVPLVYSAVKDETQGVIRDNSRPKSARDAIRADADNRMAREIARNDEAARQAAADGDAPVAAATPRGGNGALRRALRNDSVIDESKGLNTSAPAAPVSVRVLSKAKPTSQWRSLSNRRRSSRPKCRTSKIRS